MKKSNIILIIFIVVIIAIVGVALIIQNNTPTTPLPQASDMSLMHSDKFSLTYTMRNDNEIKEIYNAGDHKIKTFGGNVSISVNNNTYSLEKALTDRIITENDLLEQAMLDSQNGICQTDVANDGGSRVFWYKNFSIAKLNTVQGDKDLVIGMAGDILTLYNHAIKSNETIEIVSDKLISMYETIIDTIMPVDSALNAGPVLYLDVNSFVVPIERGTGTIENKYMGLSDKEKEILLDYCKKFKEDVKGYSMDEIKAQGLFDEENLYIKNGFLITASNITNCTENIAEMEVMKYCSGLGAVGFTYKLTYENDKWNVETSGAWIS